MTPDIREIIVKHLDEVILHFLSIQGRKIVAQLHEEINKLLPAGSSKAAEISIQSIYRCVRRLERYNLITTWRPSKNYKKGAPENYCSISEDGKKYVKNQKAIWNGLSQSAGWPF